MPKHKKKRTKKYRATYKTDGRVDMSQGGRVGYREGDAVEERNARAEAIRQNRENNRGDLDRGGYGPPGGGFDYGNIPGAPPPAPTPAPTPAPAMQDAKRTAEQIVAGEVKPPQVPDAVKVEAGKAGVARKMDVPTELEAVEAVAPEAPEAQVVTGVEQAEAPTPLTAAQIEAAQVTEAPEVAVAEGEVRPEALAEAAEVERVAPIEAAKVEIPEGALIEAVVGTVSPEAKAEAAQVAGTTLARVTRAKKQLANAGLSSADIAELGNDPEALEERLMDFSEAERGMIAGLPEEALVSTQIDGLLTGIEEGEIPAWAAPAVANVEAMLARRGLSASSVGRDNLFNAIIQSAVPLAQSNAQAIQQSVTQQRTIEAQTAEANAQRMQQTALTNSSNVGFLFSFTISGYVFTINLNFLSAKPRPSLLEATINLTQSKFSILSFIDFKILSALLSLIPSILSNSSFVTFKNLETVPIPPLCNFFIKPVLILLNLIFKTKFSSSFKDFSLTIS